MKSIRSFWFLSALFTIALAAVLVFAPSAAQAQSAAEAAVSSQLSPASAPAPTPAFYTTGEFWTGLFAAVTGLLAIWKNSQASTAQKINASLVLGIEEATKIPQVAAYESHIKQTIRAKAQTAGVQPLLHRIVKDLTEPPHDADES